MKIASTVAIALVAACAQAVLPIQVQGNRFIHPGVNVKDDGTQFSIIGVDYQPGGASQSEDNSSSDVLTDANACLRDAYVLQQLGVNAIRIYTVSPWLNHDECMSVFNDAGIYVILDVNSPSLALSRSNPASSYNSDYLNRVFGMIDAFKGYPNTLAFISGNEVVNDANSAKVVPKYIRAVQRDMRQYISIHASRDIPVVYAAADDVELRQAMWMYLECDAGEDECSQSSCSGTKTDSRSSGFGLNSYDWCNRDNWQSSGYGALLSTYQNSSIPVFMAETGCNVESPRTFNEINDGIYANLEAAFSGALVYEYSQETSNYGLVELKSDNSANMLQDFDNLQSAYSKVTLPTVSSSKLAKTISAPKCDAKAINQISSTFDADWDLPSCPASSMLKNGGGNRNVGKIVDISSLQSKYAVYDSNGKVISDAEINVAASNTINAQIGASTSGSASASAATKTSKSKAGAVDVAPGGLLAALFAAISLVI